MLVKVLGLSFAMLLFDAHSGDVNGRAFHRPLSMFRDSQPSWIGYALFLILIAIGLETARTAWRAYARIEALAYLASSLLLMVVAFTPSFDYTHNLCAFLLLGCMFAYFAILLFVNRSFFWLFFHVQIPSYLIFATQLRSYGIWQKGMILYFLLVTIIHHHFLLDLLPSKLRVSSKKTTVRVALRPTSPPLPSSHRRS